MLNKLCINKCIYFSWTTHTSTDIGKAQQHINFLGRLKKESLPQKLLVKFYRCAECIDMHHILVSCNSTSKEQRALQRVKKKLHTVLPSIEDIYLSRYWSRTSKISSLLVGDTIDSGEIQDNYSSK